MRALQVKRQRERFRKEALRREREASIAKGNAEQLTRDNQDLRRENMHLYKKIRQADGSFVRLPCGSCLPQCRLSSTQAFLSKPTTGYTSILESARLGLGLGVGSTVVYSARLYVRDAAVVYVACRDDRLSAVPATMGLLRFLPCHVRFVMSYGGKGGGGGLEDAGGDGERETESKYERLYEADLDPFKEFDSRKSYLHPRLSRYLVYRCWSRY